MKSMFFNKILSIFKLNKKAPKKLGIALGSGGAKGMAHIGILRAFEEEGINFDIVAGSSIGSIIGGMYAAGFSTSAMTAYISELNITEPQTLIKLKLQGMTVEKMLDRMMGGANIEDLAMPYCAVASDIDSGEEIDLKSGNVARAMCASSAILPLFKPVLIDNHRLMDGAYTCNVPSKVSKNMGADFVIGVNLSAEIATNGGIKATLDKYYRNNKIPLVNRKDEPYKYCDYMLEPDLKEYSSSSLRYFEEIQERGYTLAKSKMPEIKNLLVKAGIISKKNKK